MCGCKQITPISKRNRKELGHIKGEHQKYLRGHSPNNRSLPDRGPEWRAKISKTRKEKGIARGKNNPNWRGGRTSLSQRIRNSDKYKRWRWNVFLRDGFKCTDCDTEEGPFNADHVVPLCVLIENNNVISLDEALECIELWHLSNGRTLCENCHKNTDSYGWKATNNYLRKKNES